MTRQIKGIRNSQVDCKKISHDRNQECKCCLTGLESGEYVFGLLISAERGYFYHPFYSACVYFTEMFRMKQLTRGIILLYKRIGWSSNMRKPIAEYPQRKIIFIHHIKVHLTSGKFNLQ